MNKDVYNINDMPLADTPIYRSIQNKILNNKELNFTESFLVGKIRTTNKLGLYDLKPNCVYITMSKELYEKYITCGFIIDPKLIEDFNSLYYDSYLCSYSNDIYWYLGGIPKHNINADVILECPAYKCLFMPDVDNGSRMVYDPSVRYMKSSGYYNPVPIQITSLIKHPYFKEDLDDEMVLSRTS